MQRISESAESLFGDLHKPFSTASVKSGVFGSSDERPLYLQKRRQSGHSRTAA
jgi:hypothetical protein